jgi:two-component system sensor histidine kinase YesM
MFLSAVIAVGVGTGLIYRQANTIIKRQAIDYATADTEGIDTNLSKVFENGKNVSLKIAMNSDVIDACRNVFLPASYETFDQYKQIGAFLTNLLANDPMIEEVVVYRSDGTNFHSGNSFIPQNRTLGTGEGMEDGKLFLMATGEDGVPEIYMTRRMVYMKQTIGMIYVKLNRTYLASLYEKASIPEIMLFTFDDRGSLLCGNKKGLGLLEEKPLEQETLFRLEGEPIATIAGQKLFVLSRFDTTYGIKTISLIPYRILVQDSLLVKRMVFLIVLVCIVLSFLFSWFISNYLSRDLGKLRRTMLKIRHGDLHVPMNYHYNTQEVSDLAEIFGAMMHSITQLMDKNAEVEQKRKEVEKEYLNLQIQPHFIYGTINSMQYLAHLHGETELEQVATALVELLRAVLGNDEQFVPIRKEKYYIEQYLVIQRCKFRKSFVVNWDIPDAILSYPIPKLILQPIVENALVHGIMDREDGKIDISMRQDKDKIVCRIADNGVGMSQQVPVTIRKGYVFRTIALRNVFDRMQLLYGDEGDAMIQSIPNGGTSVTLVIPV